MLRSFRMSNHRSFQYEAELLLMPAYNRSRPVVPVAAVYGANASGKSNLVRGLSFMSDAVRSSYGHWDPMAGVPRQPFRLDPTCAVAPSVFVIEVELEGVRFTYGFSADDARFREEWLYSYPEKRRRILFERTDDTIRFGTTIPEQRGKAGVLGELIRSNALFLSLSGQATIEPLLPMYRWFASNLRFQRDGPSVFMSERIAWFINQNPSRRAEVLRLLGAADLGIGDIRVEYDEDPTWRRALRHAEMQAAEARHMHGTAKDDESTAKARIVVAETDARLADLRGRAGRTRPRLVFLHGPEAVEFDLKDESDGTRAWLSMLPQCIDTLDRGGVLVIDEIDSSLHPRLTAYLVGLFQDRETNPHNAQLIFTTHDTTLLGPGLGEQVLKRDQVWFVEKGESGGTRLYPLTDFRPRSEENTERRYLAGSYGAVPIVSDISPKAAGADG